MVAVAAVQELVDSLVPAVVRQAALVVAEEAVLARVVRRLIADKSIWV